MGRRGFGAYGRLSGLESEGLMERVDLSALFFHFLALWFVAIGGPSAILPDINRYVVDLHHLLSNREFAELYTLAQAAPGPNVMYTTLIGWHLAGWSGALATTIPLLVPATTLTLIVGHFIERYPDAPILRAIRRGLTPITIGLMFAGATVLMRAVSHDWRGYLTTILTAAIVLRLTCNPLWMLAAGAILGIVGVL
jgi:chromate transporter